MRGLRRFMVHFLLAALVIFLLGGLAVVVFESSLTYHPHPLAEGRLDELVRELPPGDGEFSEVEIRTEDGETLVGWLGRPSDPVGTILWLHGNAGSVEHRFPEIVRFVRESRLTVLVPDYRGFGRSTGSPSEAGIYADGGAALDWLVASGVPEDEITLLGRSLGGAVAIELALHRPVKALVLDGTPASSRDMAKVMVPFFPVGWFIRSRFANDEKIGRLDLPILHLHGRRDEIVPFSQAKRLSRLAPVGSYEFVPVEGAGHLDLSEVMGRDYYERVRKLAAGD